MTLITLSPGIGAYVLAERLEERKPPDPELLDHLIDRWLRLPGNLTIGLVSATPVVEAIRSAASRAEASG